MSPYGALTDDDFSYGTPAVDHVVKSIRWGFGSDNLFFVPDPALSSAAVSNLVLQIGPNSFPLADATVSSGRKYKWTDAYEMIPPPPRNSMTSTRLRTSTQVCSVAIVPDTTAPEFMSATGNGASLVLTYNEDMDFNFEPATSAFTVTVAGSGRTVSAVGVWERKVRLRLASAVAAGEAVTVAYAKPATNPVQDVVGNEAASLTAQSATNETADANLVCGATNLGGNRQVWTGTVTVGSIFHGIGQGFQEGTPVMADTTPPGLNGDPTVDGATLTIAYDEPLDDTSEPAPGAYAVTVAGSPRTVSALPTRPPASGSKRECPNRSPSVPSSPTTAGSWCWAYPSRGRAHPRPNV